MRSRAGRASDPVLSADLDSQSHSIFHLDHVERRERAGDVSTPKTP